VKMNGTPNTQIVWSKTNRYNYHSTAGVVRWDWKGRWAAFALDSKGKPEQYGLLCSSKEGAMRWCEVAP